MLRFYSDPSPWVCDHLVTQPDAACGMCVCLCVCLCSQLYAESRLLTKEPRMCSSLPRPLECSFLVGA